VAEVDDEDGVLRADFAYDRLDGAEAKIPLPGFGPSVI